MRLLATTSFAILLPFLSCNAGEAKEEALQIYRVLFKDRSHIVLQKIERKEDKWEAISDKEYPESLKEELPGLEPSTLAAYVGASTPEMTATRLTQDDDIGVKITFVDAATLKEIFSNDAKPDEGFKRFRKRFGVDRLTSVSPVAFNTKKTQALVLMQESFGSVGGKCATYFFEKRNGEWVLVGSFIESMS